MAIPFAFKHFNERFELQITARWYQVLFAFCSSRAILIPGFFVIAGTREGVANYLFNPHSRVRIPSRDTRKVRTTRTLWIFAQRKLDPRHSARKNKFRPGPPVLDLHHGV